MTDKKGTPIPSKGETRFSDGNGVLCFLQVCFPVAEFRRSGRPKSQLRDLRVCGDCVVVTLRVVIAGSNHVCIHQSRTLPPGRYFACVFSCRLGLYHYDLSLAPSHGLEREGCLLCADLFRTQMLYKNGTMVSDSALISSVLIATQHVGRVPVSATRLPTSETE